MIITTLYTNHLKNPIGYRLDNLCFSWIVEETNAKEQQSARVEIATDEEMSNIIFSSGDCSNISSIAYYPIFLPQPCSRYYWRVSVTADNGDTATSPTQFFETGKMNAKWEGSWISPTLNKDTHPIMKKSFNLAKAVSSARMYITGLGVYECYINSKLIGDDILAPFFNDYNSWIQYQCYDVTEHLSTGEQNIEVMLGNGWYKGRFGFVENMCELYGDEFALICELKIKYVDGSSESVISNSDWSCHVSPVLSSSIYDGEHYDARIAANKQESFPVKPPKKELPTPSERLSPPVRIIEKLKPQEIITTPTGELVLDFGQLFTGWLEFDIDIPEGSEVFLQFGELLQNGCFYNENLRTAKQEYLYISDGKKAHVRPHFTFYGFRYVKLIGIDSPKLEAFTGCVIHSDLEFIGSITTSNEKVNRLIQNAIWGQRGNFLDVPTDCPQRDERMGWTGDAQVFAATASFNMYTPAFYKKYMQDMLHEQHKLDGAVPHVVPDILDQIYLIQSNDPNCIDNDANAYASCAWADAATVIPWVLYLYYGDTSLLSSQYENMKLWLEYIRKQDNNYLWNKGFHFADWLALDNPEQGSYFGRTDHYYLASAYYYYSCTLVAKAASVLGKHSDAKLYGDLKLKIRDAIIREYFTPSGRLAVDTQTAAIIALFMDFTPEYCKERTINSLKEKIVAKNMHMDTGFVGTAYLCLTLAENGLDDIATTLLLNEDYPSWLYEVNMGATTVWERWNSVLPNGLVSDTGMNSMNHYAYGSILEWMYRYLCGLSPVEAQPGFKVASINPRPDKRFDFVKAEYKSASGVYKLGWKLNGDSICYNITIPFNSRAELTLPANNTEIRINNISCNNTTQILTAGNYEIVAKI